MNKRVRNLNRLGDVLACSPVTALLGARQIGKTTLALQYLKDNPGKYLDLETHADQLRLSNAELDILLFWNGKRFGFEIKYSENPQPGRSARIAIEDLNLDHLWCIYPGEEIIPIDEDITLWPLRNLYSHPLLTELS